MPFPKKAIPDAWIVERYQSGDSNETIARAAHQIYGVSITWVAVRKRLIKAGVYVVDRKKVITPLRTFAKKPQGHSTKRRYSCAFEGCYELAIGEHLYCKLHQRRVDRHGSPYIVMARGRKRGKEDS